MITSSLPYFRHVFSIFQVISASCFKIVITCNLRSISLVLTQMLYPQRPPNPVSFHPGQVVRRLISTNPGLNFNPSFFFSRSEAFRWIIFAIHFSVFNHQIVDEKNKNELVF